MERLSLHTPEKDWGLAKVDELSRGMQQKVQFIGTLLHDPDLVILDEPFSGLDPINAQALKDTVVDLKHRGKTVIFSTHLMDNAERLCDSVCIIAQRREGARRRGDGGEGGSAATARSRSRSVARRHPASRPSSPTASLVHRMDDNNRYFEIELAAAADPQGCCGASSTPARASSGSSA